MVIEIRTLMAAMALIVLPITLSIVRRLKGYANHVAVMKWARIADTEGAFCNLVNVFQLLNIKRIARAP